MPTGEHISTLQWANFPNSFNLAGKNILKAIFLITIPHDTVQGEECSLLDGIVKKLRILLQSLGELTVDTATLTVV